MVLIFKVIISLQVSSGSNNLTVGISSLYVLPETQSCLCFVLEGQGDKPGAKITLKLSLKTQKKKILFIVYV